MTFIWHTPQLSATLSRIGGAKHGRYTEDTRKIDGRLIRRDAAPARPKRRDVAPAHPMLPHDRFDARKHPYEKTTQKIRKKFAYIRKKL